MGRKERLDKLEKHIQKNPTDYQSVISYFKLNSDRIEWERKQARIPRLRKIAECRRQLNEKCVSE